MANSAFSVTGTSGSGGSGITTIDGDTGSVTGTTVTITGGTSGLTFSGSVATLTLAGTLNAANGGTGFNSTTTYGLITGGTTSSGALQNAGTGTLGEVYVSGGSAALGTWTPQTNVGTWQLINNQSFTTQPTVTLNNLGTYRNAYLIINLQADDDPQTLQMLWSTNNGSTWLSSLYEYFVESKSMNAGTTAIANAVSASNFILSNSSKYFILNINFTNIGEPFTSGFSGNGWGHDISSPINNYGYSIYGTNLNGAGVNAIQLSVSSGTISGEVWMWGLLPTT